MSTRSQKLFALICACSLLLAACRKEAPQRPAAPPSVSDTFTVSSAAWSTTTTWLEIKSWGDLGVAYLCRTAERDLPMITKTILDKGAVHVYADLGYRETQYVPVPAKVRTSGLPFDINYHYTLAEGKITLYVYFTQVMEVPPPPVGGMPLPSVKFKVVVTPARTAGVDGTGPAL
ncbi:hypothetical protein ACWKWU_04060 [Chitinophaga lutea]